MLYSSFSMNQTDFCDAMTRVVQYIHVPMHHVWPNMLKPHVLNGPGCDITHCTHQNTNYSRPLQCCTCPKHMLDCINLLLVHTVPKRNLPELWPTCRLPQQSTKVASSLWSGYQEIVHATRSVAQFRFHKLWALTVPTRARWLQKGCMFLTGTTRGWKKSGQSNRCGCFKDCFVH